MSKTKIPAVSVKLNEKDPEPVELIAKSIIEIADGFAKINASKLNRRALLILLKDSTGLGMSEIGKVLDAVPKLKDMYLKK